MTRHQPGTALRWRWLAAAAITLTGVALAPVGGRGAPARDATEAGSFSAAFGQSAQVAATTRVIVAADAGRIGEVSRAARRLGGEVVSTQESLGSLVLDLPAGRVGRLRAAPGVASVTEDMRVTLSGRGGNGGGSEMSEVARDIGADAYWRDGYFGQDVDVALLDSGVLPVEGLTRPNKLVIGPDLSPEGRWPHLRGMDTFGHGTHMAGIIAGLDPGVTPATLTAHTQRFAGIAPGARLVSVKLADARGRTEVSQVVAGIDWVVSHAHDPGLNIRVLNLSFGADPGKDYRLDPLAHAAEVAWDHGIVVVVSAGNSQSDDEGLSSPAYDPNLLAVGTLDERGTDDRDDDDVAPFSRKGRPSQRLRAPDLVAPGISVLSLRAPGSFLDQTYGETAAVGERFFKGTGTSQSAAVVSGAAALVLSERPDLSPDELRGLLRRSARPLRRAARNAQGDGALDLEATHERVARLDTPPAPALTGPLLGTGTGATNDLTSVGWDRAEWSGDPGSGARWNGFRWRGATWAGATWAGATWAGATWAGATWAGATWAGATWAGATWAGATWAGATWAGATWAGATWADSSWSSESWGE